MPVLNKHTQEFKNYVNIVRENMLLREDNKQWFQPQAKRRTCSLSNKQPETLSETKSKARPHGVPAASLTEGQQQSLHASTTQSTCHLHPLAMARLWLKQDHMKYLLPPSTVPPCTTHIEHTSSSSHGNDETLIKARPHGVPDASVMDRQRQFTHRQPL